MCERKKNIFKKEPSKIDLNPQPCDYQTTALPSSPSLSLTIEDSFYYM
jgi:hypothetical protein